MHVSAVSRCHLECLARQTSQNPNPPHADLPLPLDAASLNLNPTKPAHRHRLAIALFLTQDFRVIARVNYYLGGCGAPILREALTEDLDA